jgi:parallel beta-helix repeat protein
MKKLLIVMFGLSIICSGFIGLFYFGTENVNAQTYVSGNITTNTKWTLTGSPYIIKSDIYVQKGVTLTIEPGVIVKFDGEYSLVIDGLIKAKGTKTNTIKFTSNQTTPHKGDWYTIRLRTGNNRIDWAEIQYAKYGVFITYYGGNNYISNTTFNSCSVDGIYITNSNNNSILNCNITSNNGYGITIYDSDYTIVKNINIKNNNYFGIYLNASTYTQIQKCNITNTFGKGIILYSNSHHTSIINCVLDNNKNKGIDFSGASHNKIKNTIIKSNTGIGVDFGGVTTNQSFKNCMIIDNGYTGIDLRGSSNVEILNCNISRNFGYGGIYSEKPVNNITISNTDIFNNFAGNGIDFYGASQVNLNNSWLIGNVGNGISLGPSDSVDNVIKNCEISKNTGRGIHFISKFSLRTDASGNDISYNNVSFNSFDGIYYDLGKWNFQEANENKIYNNDIYSNNGHGLGFELYYYNSEANKNLIFNNSIFLNSENGIYFNSDGSADNNLIHNNSIFLNDESGIYFCNEDSTSFNKIFGNNLYFNSENGLHFIGKHNSLVQYNKIYSNLIFSNIMNGVLIEADEYRSRMEYNLLNYNVIRSNNQSGIKFRAGPHNYASVSSNSITNNTISNNTLTGIYFYAEEPGYIWGNKIINCSIAQNGFGIKLVNSIVNSINKCLISNNVDTGIELLSKANSNNMENNNITSNQHSGIFISTDSNNNIITHNDISTNLKVGINVTDTEGQKIHHNNFKNNTMNAFDSTNALNNWDDGAQGNSWSDYMGTDDNRDGFGEDPYVIPGGGSRDWHPFIEFINFTHPKILTILPPDLSENVSIYTKIIITFSKVMNTSLVESATSISGEIPLINPIWSNDNKIFTFEPAVNLSFNTTYFINVSTLAQDAFGNPLLKDFSSQFTTGPPKKPTPPEIIAKSPTGSDVPINTKISITFSELMDPSSVESAFSISPSVAGRFTWKNTKLSFIPNNLLKYKTRYTVTINTNAKDLEHEFIQSNFIWNFSTTSPLQPHPPTIVRYSPTGSNVPVNSKIIITFSELMDTNSVESAFKILPITDGTFIWNHMILTFTPESDLEHNKQYIITIENTAKDLENECLKSSFSWQFTTVPKKIPSPPTIIDKSPIGIEVPIDSIITIKFSELMDTGSVESAISIFPIIKGNFKWNSDMLTYIPRNPLENSTQYIITISTNAKDLENEHLASDFTWQFTTVSKIERTPPYITDNSPIGVAVDVRTKITITFSESMDKDSVEKAFSISPDIKGTFTWLGNVLTFTPSNPLEFETTYSIKISIFAKDLEDEALENNYIWQFTTIQTVIQSSELDHLVIIPVPIEIKVGDKQQFKAKGFDKSGNELSNLTFDWDILGIIGTIDDQGYFTAKSSGHGIITVSSEGKKAQISIEVIADEDLKDESKLSDKGKKESDTSWTWLLIIILICVILLIFLLIMRKKKAKTEPKTEPASNIEQNIKQQIFQKPKQPQLQPQPQLRTQQQPTIKSQQSKQLQQPKSTPEPISQTPDQPLKTQPQQIQKIQPVQYIKQKPTPITQPQLQVSETTEMPTKQNIVTPQPNTTTQQYQQPVKQKSCKICGLTMKYYAQNKRYYCNHCKKYD